LRFSAVRPAPDASVRDDSHRLGLPSQGSRLTADPGTEVPKCPSWSSAPLQRHGRQGPLNPGLPHPARSAPGVSHPLDGLPPCHFATSRAAAIHGVSIPASVVRNGLPRLATRRAIRTRCDPVSHSEEREARRFELKCPSPFLLRSVSPEGAPNLPGRGSPREMLHQCLRCAGRSPCRRPRVACPPDLGHLNKFRLTESSRPAFRGPTRSHSGRTTRVRSSFGG
jgi:hypothetical protein